VVAANFLIDSESNLRSAINAFGSQGAQSGAPVTPMTHRGEGSVEAVDLAQASVSLTHGPIASLKWPGMTMDFHVKDPALLRTLKPGQSISFEFVAETGGEYNIVRVQPATAAKPVREPNPAIGPKRATEPRPAASEHQGH